MWRISAAFSVDRQFRNFYRPQFGFLIVARFGTAIGVYKLAYFKMGSSEAHCKTGAMPAVSRPQQQGGISRQRLNGPKNHLPATTNSN
jgi:hypothetical protein